MIEPIPPGQPVPNVMSLKTLTLRHLGDDGEVREIEVHVAKHTDASKAAKAMVEFAKRTDAERER